MKRRVTVNEFNGFFYVNIREFYMDKNGTVKPGNKGLALTFQNWDQMYNQVQFYVLIFLNTVLLKLKYRWSRSTKL
jgi:hypothetical protein